jgi:hypothetical protein
MVSVKFLKSPPAEINWCTVVLDPFNRSQHSTVQTIVDSYSKNLKDCGVPNTARVLSKVTTPEAMEPLMREWKHKNCSFVFVLLPNETFVGEYYNKVKTIGDIKVGIHTSICQYEKVVKKLFDERFPTALPQFLANMALKVNCKLGGQNQGLEPIDLGIIDKGETMVVGIDVTHPSPGSASTAPSIAAVVASTGKTCSQFPGELSRQASSRNETVEQLTVLVKNRLTLWRSRNQNKLPGNILVYRDGVSEGQFTATCLEQEIPAIRKAFAPLYQKGQQPRLTYIVVGKRHNVRFYPAQASQGKWDERTGNCVAGTVVDRGITDPHLWEFYLQAHGVLQGTGKFAHYVAIVDEIFTAKDNKPPPGMTVADVVEKLTNNLCYMFQRATKSVSYAPPAYYADLLCERARRYLQDEFDPKDDASSMKAPSKKGAANLESETKAEEDKRAAEHAAQIRVHADLRDTMYYL